MKSRVLLGVWLLGVVVHGAIPSVVVGPTKPWNIKGDTLVLDIGSLSFQGNHPYGPPFTDPAVCAQYCEKTLGCTGWTFCNKTSGCGSGCEEYVKANPQLSTLQNDNPTIPSQSWYSLSSINAFGPWGQTAGCLRNCSWASSGGNYQCKPTGRWPMGMCSLKKLSNPAQPQYWTQNAADGWVSGYYIIPSQCRGVSARACKRCISSRSPDACTSCAKNSQIRPRLLDSVLASVGVIGGPDGCGVCYNSTAPDKCTACLFGKKSCAACATEPDDPRMKMDVSTCIDCTNKYGSSYSSACVNCGALGASSGNVQKCLTCLQRASRVACSQTAWPPVCWNPEGAGTSSCATCVTSAKDFEACVSCLERKPYTDSCTSCALLPDAARQARCYACAKASNSPYSSCTDCLTYLTDPKAVDQCLSCVTNPKALAEGKQWCWGCQNWCSTYETRGKCSQCLATKQDNYLQACSCQ